MPVKRPFLLSLTLIAILAAALAACSQDSPPPRATSTPTFQPVVTRIVTPLPTFTPQPTPTLSYDLFGVAGGWGMRFRFDINDGGFADQIRYSGGADVQVNLDGSVTGTGYLAQQIFDEPCAARVMDNDPLTFDIQGSTRPVGDQVWVDLTLLPSDPFKPERFQLICPAFNDVRDFNQPLLWPILLALSPRDWGSAAFDKTAWSFPLTGNQVYTFEANIPQETGVLPSGMLAGEVLIDRN